MEDSINCHFIQQISSAHPQMTYVYAKNGHKKPDEKFRDLCSAGTCNFEIVGHQL